MQTVLPSKRRGGGGGGLFNFGGKERERERGEEERQGKGGCNGEAGRVFSVGLDAEGNGSYRCRFCDNPLAVGDHLLSTLSVSFFLSVLSFFRIDNN